MLKPVDFSAVIFDMDGLVLDTEKTYRLAWQQAAYAMGYDFPASFFRALSGLQSLDVERELRTHCGAGFDLNEFNRLSALYWRRHVNACGIEVKHGFTMLLDYLILQNIPYCLATNSGAANAYECLELAGLKDVFAIIVAREQVRHGKPTPDIFLKAAESLRIPIGRCLVLEDSHAGIEAASRAGAVPVLIPSVLPVNALTAALCDWIVSDLAELLAAIQDNSAI
jgi:beta-phosphoglucomutase-like phosphatase (HAD superfamily)